jgi:hypothetical protein
MLDFTIAEDAGRLGDFGISRRYVESIAADDPTLEQELRRQLLGDAFAQGGTEPEVDETVRSAIMSSGLRYLTYVDTILMSGHFLALCPISGRAVSSEGSFVVDPHHIAYRFRGEVVFYLLVGRFHGRRSALCIPSHRLLIGLDVPEVGPPILGWVANVMRRLIACSLAEPDKFRARIASDTDGLTLVAGGTGNFGHHVWQELTGIAKLLAAGHLPRVRSLLVGPHTWFSLDQVFPEFAGIPVTKCGTSEEMLVNGLDQPGTILRPVGMQISEDARFRCWRAATVALGSEEIGRISAAGAQSQLVWINLRAHNKRWVSQVDGYSSLLNSLQAEFGNIGVVYDGWIDTAQIRDEIDRRLRADIVRHDTLGASIESSLAWAEAVTTYVSVVGSGLVLNSWLAHKPGIAHANRVHLRQCSFWNSVSPGMVPVTFVDSAAVTCDGTGYGNYDFDWRVLLPSVRDAIRQPATQF